MLAQSGASYDNLGQVYQTTTYDVSSGSVVTAGDLVDNYWYDAAGNQIESLPGGTEEFTKSAYDSLGQLTNIYTGYDGNNATCLSYAETSSVTSDDTILEQTDYSYDEAGDVALTTTHQRFHDDTTTTGGPDGVEPRTSYTADWYDAIGRAVVEANYGTQIPSDTSTYGRPATAPTWDSGTGTWDNNPDGALISTVAYDAAGNAVQTRDNAGRLATSL